MEAQIRLKKMPNVLKKERLQTAVKIALQNAAAKYKEMTLDYIDEGKSFRNRTGVLRQSIIAVNNRVAAMARYAPFVEFGTRPHIILPRRKKALRFIKDDKEIFAKRVRHPGSKAYPFLFADIQRRKEEVAKIFIRSFVEELS